MIYLLQNMKKQKNKNLKGKTILITGGSGLIGSYFLKSYSGKLRGDNILYPSHKELDITKVDSVKRFFEFYEPEDVVHFAAFRDATEAEKQRGERKGDVWRVNVEGSENIAKICKYFNCYLIQISTDYVFAGHKKNKGPYAETDEPKDHERLLSWYGITKREAERRVLGNLGNASVIRICNITRQGNILELDYVGKIFWLYNQKKIYPMFDDQFLTLTYIPSLFNLIFKLLKLNLTGIYHVSTPDLVTPYNLANYLIEKIYRKRNEIKATSIDPYLKKYPGRYPKFGGLLSDFTQKKLGIKFMSWKETVNLFVKDLLDGNNEDE